MLIQDFAPIINFIFCSGTEAYLSMFSLLIRCQSNCMKFLFNASPSLFTAIYFFNVYYVKSIT